MTDAERLELRKQAAKLAEAIANLGYPVGMGLGPHPKDAEKIIRKLSE